MPWIVVAGYGKQGTKMVLAHTNLISIYNLISYFSNCYATQLTTFDAFMINGSWIISCDFLFISF